MTDEPLVELVMGWIETLNQQPVPREYVYEAISRINSGKEDVQRYPSGAPAIRDVYNVATRLESEKASKN